MTTALPPKTPAFTPEQRRRLGQVYSLILRWRNEDKKNDDREINSGSALDRSNTQVNLSERSE